MNNNTCVNITLNALRAKLTEVMGRLAAAEAKLEKIKNLKPETLNTSEIVLVELKTKVGKLSPSQVRVIATLRSQGVSVYVIDNVEDFEKMLDTHNQGEKL